MGLHMQGGGTMPMPPLLNGDHKISGSLRSAAAAAAAAHRISDHGGSDQEETGLFRPYRDAAIFNGLGRSPLKLGRGKRLNRIAMNRIARGRHCSVGIFVVLLLCVVLFTILGSDYLFSVGRSFAGPQDISTSGEFSNDEEMDLLWINQQTERKRLHGTSQSDTGESFHLMSGNRGKGRSDLNEAHVHFGQTVDQKEGHRDSRYWDSDDRKREMTHGTQANEASVRLQDMVKESGSDENIGDSVESSNWDLDDRLRERITIKREAGSDNPKYGKSGTELSKVLGKAPSNFSEKEISVVSVKNSATDNVVNLTKNIIHKYNGGHSNVIKAEDDTFSNPGLYNEQGRKELTVYEQKFEAGLNSPLIESTRIQQVVDKAEGDEDGYEDADEDDEDETVFTSPSDENGSLGNEKSNIGEERIKRTEDKQYKMGHGQVGVSNPFKTKRETYTIGQFQQLANEGTVLNTSDVLADRKSKVDAVRKQILMDSSQPGTRLNSFRVEVSLSTPLETSNGSTGQVSKAPPNRIILEPKISQSGRRRKHSGAACKINFPNSTLGLRERNLSKRFLNFSLSYVNREERPFDNSEWKPRFAGHQTLLERERSFRVGNNMMHCGFVQGPTGSPSTGFELSENDTKYLNTCQIAVSSCIFGNSDYIRSPDHKKISVSSKEKVCFVMFVDQKSLDVMIEEGQISDENHSVGLWKLVLVKNPPYSDGRRTGKVPKFLSHRLFPSARYSIWIDSKLRLLSDPLLILEHFLWRGGHEYAISNHYDRHCVSEEVQQNKKLNKFNHSVIDEQFAFYQQDGLELFNVSDPNRLLPSYVPEGSFIIRAHTPMSNLFSCLWFNEVDRFTPRDQLSFAYTYLKLVRTNPGKYFRFHMIKDCERKAMAKLFRHKQEKVL